jgi:hypothetical protein
MNDLMIDLETMGTGPNAAIVAIGAVLIDLDAGTLCDTPFYSPVRLEDSVSHGLTMDAGTVMWWLRQSDAARAAISSSEASPPGGSLQWALNTLRWYIEKYSDPKSVRVWGNGASFDCVILANAYRAIGKQPPWRYYNERCYRTVKALHPDVPMEREGTHHQALHDAMSQARHLVAMLCGKEQPAC